MIRIKIMKSRLEMSEHFRKEEEQISLAILQLIKWQKGVDKQNLN